MSSEYSDTQAVMNSRYRTEYQKWVAGLTPKQRRELEAQGLLTPQVDPLCIGKGEDVAELPIADPVALPHDCEHESQPQEACDEERSEAIWAALRRLIGELLADSNPALGVECLALASGVGFLGTSMTDIAKRHRVTKAAVSKRCVQWTDLLRLMPSRAMRKLTARQSYRTAQISIQAQHEQFNSSRVSDPAD